jgi:hypothetical protein
MVILGRLETDAANAIAASYFPTTRVVNGTQDLPVFVCPTPFSPVDAILSLRGAESVALHSRAWNGNRRREQVTR